MRQASPLHRVNAPLTNINGDAIYSLRKDGNLSLRTVVLNAALNGRPVSRSTISKAECGTPISRKSLQAIAYALTTALGRTITVDDLLTKDQS